MGLRLAFLGMYLTMLCGGCTPHQEALHSRLNELVRIHGISGSGYIMVDYELREGVDAGLVVREILDYLKTGSEDPLAARCPFPSLMLRQKDLWALVLADLKGQQLFLSLGDTEAMRDERIRQMRQALRPSTTQTIRDSHQL